MELKSNIDFLKNFIGDDWANSEFKKTEDKSLLKGLGTRFDVYHPYVNYVYELEAILFRAGITKSDDVALGQYSYILNNAGALLRYNYDRIVDKKDAQQKLRSNTQFYDLIWELEVSSMLSLSGANVTFNNPNINCTNDITAFIDNRPLSIECKNKIMENEKFVTNSIFITSLANKLTSIQTIKNKIIEIEFDSGKYEDLKVIVSTVRDKFDIFDYQSIMGRYRVRTLKIPFNTPLQNLLYRKGVNSLIAVSQCPERELCSDIINSKDIISKLLFKFPEPDNKLKNLNKVLQKANKQLTNGGVVFLQVPYSLFENTKNDVKRELSHCLSNISAVKLISYGVEDLTDVGVKVRRNEDLIVSDRAVLSLTEREIKFLSQPLAFKKFNYLQSASNVLQK